ncbi:MAG: hypothetical protein J6D03_00300 [Clostridia bacterium]|nr:hypothetical protein [Clostridia bacterium]
MIDIREYISNKHLKLPDYLGNCSFEEYVDINNINEDNIEESQVYYFYRYNFDHIIGRSFNGHLIKLNEALKSYKAKNLISLLKKKFSDIDIAIIHNGNKGEISSIELQFKSNNDFIDDSNIENINLKDNDKSKRLLHILNFNGYDISQIIRYRDIYCILVEPQYQEDIKQTLDNLIFYHITNKKNVDNIKKCGLRPRQGISKREKKNKKSNHYVSYRMFSSRTYLIHDPKDKEKLRKNILNVIYDLQYNGEYDNNYSILKCDLTNYNNITINIDTVSVGENNMYTIYPIDPKCITVYDNLDELMKQYVK